MSEKSSHQKRSTTNSARRHRDDDDDTNESNSDGQVSSSRRFVVPVFKFSIIVEHVSIADRKVTILKQVVKKFII